MNSRSNSFNKAQRKRNKRRILSVFLFLILVLVILSDRQQKSMIASDRFSIDDYSVKVLSFIAIPIRGIESLTQNTRALIKVYRENESLREELEHLRVFENQVLDLTLRLKRFEEILDIDNSTDVPDRKIAARAVNESHGPFVHSALLNIGVNKGVQTGHAVMSVDGLYGHVVRVGKISSRVLLLNDLNSHISVMSQRSLSRAILVGQNDRFPKLNFISDQADWKVGDRVVSSGDGGVLPRGLVIGRVETKPNDPVHLRVKLFTHDRPIDWVWVLPFSAIKAPTRDEMSTPANSEAAQTSAMVGTDKASGNE